MAKASVSLARVTPVNEHGKVVLSAYLGLDPEQIETMLAPVKGKLSAEEYDRVVLYIKSLRNSHNLDHSIRQNPKLMKVLISSALNSKVLAYDEGSSIYETPNGQVVVTDKNIEFYPGSKKFFKTSIPQHMGLQDALTMVAPVMIDESMSPPVKHRIEGKSNEKFWLMKAFSLMNKVISGIFKKEHRTIENPDWVSYLKGQANNDGRRIKSEANKYFGRAESVTSEFEKTFAPTQKISWGKPRKQRANLGLFRKALGSGLLATTVTSPALATVIEQPSLPQENDQAQRAILEAMAAYQEPQQSKANPIDGLITEIKRLEEETAAKGSSALEPAEASQIQEESSLDPEATAETPEASEDTEENDANSIDIASIEIPQEDLTRERAIELIGRYENFITSYKIAIDALNEESNLPADVTQAKIDNYENNISTYQTAIDSYKEGYLTLTEDEQFEAYQAIRDDICSNPEKYKDQSVYSINGILDAYEYANNETRKDILYRLQQEGIVSIAINDSQSEAIFTRIASFKPDDALYNTVVDNVVKTPENWVGADINVLTNGLRTIQDNFYTPYIAQAVMDRMEQQGLIELDEHKRIKTIASAITSVPSMQKAFGEATYITSLPETAVPEVAEEPETTPVAYSDDDLARFAVEGYDPEREARIRALAKSYDKAVTPEETAATEHEKAKWKPEDEQRIDNIIAGLELRAA